MLFLFLLPALAFSVEYRCPVPANAGIKEVVLLLLEKNRGELTYHFNSGLVSKPHRCVGHSIYQEDKSSRALLCIGPSILADNSVSSVLISTDKNGEEKISFQFLAKEEKDFREFSPVGPSDTCEKK
jgi:hypothetical protein